MLADVPILTVTLASANYDDYALKRVAERMAERLRSAESVSVVNIKGGRDREIAIELDPERLQAFGTTLSEAYAAFEASNLSVPLQSTVRDGKVEAIRLSASSRPLLCGYGQSSRQYSPLPCDRRSGPRQTCHPADLRYSRLNDSDCSCSAHSP